MPSNNKNNNNKYPKCNNNIENNNKNNNNNVVPLCDACACRCNIINKSKYNFSEIAMPYQKPARRVPPNINTGKISTRNMLIRTYVYVDSPNPCVGGGGGGWRSKSGL